MKKDEMIFTVDSALLSELGEKLVGSSYIALLELIKNSKPFIDRLKNCLSSGTQLSKFYYAER